MKKLAKLSLNYRHISSNTHLISSSISCKIILGNPKDAGILPRALDVLFNSIHGRQWEPMNLKPKLFLGVQKLTEDEELRERKIKEKVLKLSLDDVRLFWFDFSVVLFR